MRLGDLEGEGHARSGGARASQTGRAARALQSPSHDRGGETVHDALVLAQVRRPDGGLEDVTLEVGDLEEALARTGTTTAHLLAGRDVFHVLESARIRLAFHYDPYFAVSLSGVRALPHQLEAVYEKLLPQPRLRFVLAHGSGQSRWSFSRSALACQTTASESAARR